MDTLGARHDVVGEPPVAAASESGQDDHAREHAVELLEHQLRQLAFSLHDGPVQTLTAAGAMLERTGRAERLDTMRAEVAAAEGLLDYAVTEMRDLMQEMRPGELDEESLLAKLAGYVKRYERQSGIPVALSATGDEYALPFSIQLSLFRVVQEALTNARKHADAHKIAIDVRFGQGAVECAITDDGVGFDPDRAAALRGTSYWGLRGMRERMLLIGGDLSICSDDTGTTIAASVPVCPS
jgi:two-component system, NarL family, sensor kinase